jgi:hypothetical protein
MITKEELIVKQNIDKKLYEFIGNFLDYIGEGLGSYFSSDSHAILDNTLYIHTSQIDEISISLDELKNWAKVAERVVQEELEYRENFKQLEIERLKEQRKQQYLKLKEEFDETL